MSDYANAVRITGELGRMLRSSDDNDWNAALERIAALLAENQRLNVSEASWAAQAIEAQAENRRLRDARNLLVVDMNAAEAEVERLREALERVQDVDVEGRAAEIAREALAGDAE